MSKSIGNVVAPQDVMNKLGGDILRLWVASADYSGEMTVSDEILKRSADAYRRIRNTSRFLLANLSGYDPKQHQVPMDEMVELDRWIVGRAADLQKQLVDAYDNYQFLSVVQKLMHFCSIELGSFYLDIIKDRQYTAKADSLARRSCQTALHHIAEALVRWMAPICSFTAQEIWDLLPGEREQYVFTQAWYEGFEQFAGVSSEENTFWIELLNVRDAVNQALEQARRDDVIGGSLQAEVTLYADTALAEKLKRLGAELRFALLTSEASVADLADAPESAVKAEHLPLAVAVVASAHKKCERCWHHREEVGQISEHPDLCQRCVSNIDGAGEERHFA
jgi:isoleucyl-tRNA synthetase